ncbi:MAG TPA: hypothetical protein V6D27_13220 [Vampirovibrionales bacterium]
MRSPVGWVPVGLEASNGRSGYEIQIVGFENYKNRDGLGRSTCCSGVVIP